MYLLTLTNSKFKSLPLIMTIGLHLIFSVITNGQNVGINNPAPHSKALLDLTSSDKGLLAPRLSQAQRLAMFPAADPTAAGMIVYQTDLTTGYYYFDGVDWNLISDNKSGWSLTGNANTNPALNFIGTTDNQPWIIKTNNIEAARVLVDGKTGIGTATPVQKLHVNGNINLTNDTNNIRIGNIRAFSVAGQGNLFAGEYAGINSSSGYGNTFLGDSSGTAITSGATNTGVGKNSLKLNSGGNWNTAVGHSTLEKNTSGYSNTAMGIGTMSSNTTGYRNTAIGGGVLQNNVTGALNTGVGYYALKNNTGDFNTSVGTYSMFTNTTGYANVAIGHGALQQGTTSNWNTTIGTNSGYAMTTGYNNLFAGGEAGLSNTEGSGNVFLGISAGRSNTTGFYNAFTGAQAGYYNSTGEYNTYNGALTGTYATTGHRNTLIGAAAGHVTTTGSWNTFVGVNAGRYNTTGNSNLFIGFESGFSSTTASENTFIGHQSGKFNTTGTMNTFIGTYSGTNNSTGFNNAFLGRNAGTSNTTGYENAFFGGYAGQSNTTGSDNTFIGRDAGVNNTIGSSNTFLGEVSGDNNTSGNENTFLGQSAGFLTNVGNKNVFIGQAAGSNNTSGSSNIAIGQNAQVGSNLTNAIAIGNNAAATISNSMILGGTALKVGIGTSAPNYKLHVVNDNLNTFAVQNTQVSGESIISILDNTGVARAHFGYGNTGSGVFPHMVYAGSITNSPFIFHTNAAERMRIDPDGYVGIGTSTPAAKLDVVINNPIIPIRIHNQNNGGISGIQFHDNAGTLMGQLGYSNPGSLSFANSFNIGSMAAVPTVITTNNVERVRVDATGNVGIGTTAPTTELEVNGFTKLGTDGPAIKTKKITATSASLQTAVTNIPHGIGNHTKILSVSIHIQNFFNNSIPPGYNGAAQNEYSYFISPTEIILNYVNGNAGMITSRPVRILITYEE